ncbi:hypothetical protein PG987_003650 [Apiospora arundinis]
MAPDKRRAGNRKTTSPKCRRKVEASKSCCGYCCCSSCSRNSWYIFYPPPTPEIEENQPASSPSTKYDKSSTAQSPRPKTPQRTESIELPRQNSVVRLSNFQPTKANLKKKNDGRLQLRLSGGERLVVLGNYGIRVVSGEATLNGALLKAADKTHWVCAPQCYALPVLRCSDEAIIELSPHPAAESLERLESLSPLFRRLWNDEATSDTNGKTKPPRSTFELIFTSTYGPKKAALFDLVSPPEWNRKIDQLVAASRSKQVSVMVTGPKSSGKSTFGRLLMNNLLTYYSTASKRQHANGVAVLDLDPGQPEYCIAGQIGLVHVTEPLLGPSFCRPLLDPASTSYVPTRLLRCLQTQTQIFTPQPRLI